MSLFFFNFKQFFDLVFRVIKIYIKKMFLNPFSPLVLLKISSLKITVSLLLILLIKSNLLRLKGGIVGGLFALLLISGILASTSLALGSLVYAYKVKTKSNDLDDSINDLEKVNA